jgi:hypothetical protein
MEKKNDNKPVKSVREKPNMSKMEQLEWAEYNVNNLQVVGAMVKRPLKKQRVLLRHMLSQVGPKVFLDRANTLPAAVDASLLKEKSAKRTFELMSDIYFDNYTEEV